MKKYEANLLTAYTGILCGNASDFHKFAEQILERPILTHEFANADLWLRLKELTEKDFMNICMNLED